MFETGFLGTRAPLILDIIAIALAFVLVLQGFSIYSVRKQRYRIHRATQLTVGITMGLLIVAFELQMRIYGWRHLAEDSPFFDSFLYPSLLLHLIFAIPTFILWVLVIFGARKNFAVPPKPSKYSRIHKRLGRFTVFATIGTIFSGWLFYWIAFAAS